MSHIRYILEDRSILDEPRLAAIKRICSDPGLPNSRHSTASFWIAHANKHVSETVTDLPATTDVVIIGSGISGVSVAHNLLDTTSETVNGYEKPKFSVTVLEARGFCSGATGRNGGHIHPHAEDYSELKAVLGEDEAKKIIDFRFEHLRALLSLAKKLGIQEEIQAREVESVNVYLDLDEFDASKERLAELQKGMPELSSKYKVFNGDEARTKFGVPNAAGVICHPAGAVWPYKLTTALVSRLQKLYPERFHLATNTPAEQVILSAESESEYPYQIVTSRGILYAKHVVHCTEGYQAHLLPSFGGVIWPLRGQMSAQKPGDSFPHQGSERSWIIYYEEGYDYLTQLPVSGDASDGEMMLGGGIIPATRSGMKEIGAATDEVLNNRISAHLVGALNVIFGEMNRGKVPGDAVKAMWTGIMGFSSDGFPWVGKLPASLTGRELGTKGSDIGAEWITSGFGGEGMVHAWLCGKGLAEMISSELHAKPTTRSSNDVSYPLWLPETFRVDQRRVDQARFTCANGNH